MKLSLMLNRASPLLNTARYLGRVRYLRYFMPCRRSGGSKIDGARFMLSLKLQYGIKLIPTNPKGSQGTAYGVHLHPRVLCLVR